MDMNETKRAWEWEQGNILWDIISALREHGMGFPSRVLLSTALASILLYLVFRHVQRDRDVRTSAVRDGKEIRNPDAGRRVHFAPTEPFPPFESPLDPDFLQPHVRSDYFSERASARRRGVGTGRRDGDEGVDIKDTCVVV